jgi:regulator of protease activity HflC (stomatin/prohibitin superfamily)
MFGIALLLTIPVAAVMMCSPCFVGVDTSERGIIQTFGKFSRVADPGLNYVAWPIQSISRVSTKVRILDCMTSTKTEDNVSVEVRTVVQYAVDPSKIEEFFFKASDVSRQLEAYVDSIVRSEIPKYNLDAAFKVKDSLASTIREELSKNMAPFGLNIFTCLMADLKPDSSVLAAMNAITASRRQREANFEKAEAEKLLTVTQAQAEAEAQYISGEGVSKKRRALAAGFRECVLELSNTCGLKTQDALHATLVGQYLDVLREFAVHGRWFAHLGN